MTTMRTLLCALTFALLLLSAGCGRGPERSVEELETEDVRSERRSLHQKKFPPSTTPAEPQTPKK